MNAALLGRFGLRPARPSSAPIESARWVSFASAIKSKVGQF
jgi:hypothetical protein